jgi:hypothetical protein
MDISKISIIALKLKRRYINKKPDEIYHKLMVDPIFTPILNYNKISGIHLIYLVFILYLSNQGNSINTILKLLQNFTFGFKVYNILESVPLVACEYCDGYGMFDCDNCNRYNDTDCEKCNDTGSVACHNCDGDGDVEKINHNSVEIYSFISVSTKLKDLLIDYENEKINQSVIDSIRNNVLTIQIYNEELVIDDFYDDYQVDDMVLGSIDENPTLSYFNRTLRLT